MCDAPGGALRFRLKSRWQIALRYANFGRTERAVAWALSTWMKADGTGASPSLEALAKAACSGRSTVARALVTLAESGWIGRLPGGGRGNRTAYVALMPDGVEERLDTLLNRPRGGTVSADKPSQKLQETVPLVGPFQAQNRPAGGTQAFIELQAGKPSPTGTSRTSTPSPWTWAGIETFEQFQGLAGGERASILRRYRAALDPAEATEGPEIETG